MYTPAESRYNNMTYNRCGRSGLKVSALSLGLWHNFGDHDDFENARNMLHCAFDHGITHFDLANNYGPPEGAAEINFGKILKSDFHAHRDELVISSKAGYEMWPGPYGEWGSRKHILASLDQSLNRLGLDYVDIFYSHRPDTSTPLDETLGALETAIQQGKALYAGISSYNGEMTRQVAQKMDHRGHPCIVHQANYSMLHRNIEKELLKITEKHGLGIVAFCPLAQGLLSDKYLRGIPDGSRASKKNSHLKSHAITEGKLQIIKSLNLAAKARNQSLAQMALAWALRQKNVCSVLIGASNSEQIKENIKALDHLDFKPEEIDHLDSILNQ